MFQNNRPRFWVDWYDRWHLLPALILLLLICLLGYLATLPSARPTLQAGTTGAGLQAGMSLALSGTAEANSVVGLYDRDRSIATTQADPNGAFKFVVPNLAAGAHLFKVVALAGDAQMESDTLSVAVNP